MVGEVSGFVCFDDLVVPAEAGGADGEGVSVVGFRCLRFEEGLDGVGDGVGLLVLGVEVEEDEGVEAVLTVFGERPEDGVWGGFLGEGEGDGSAELVEAEACLGYGC